MDILFLHHSTGGLVWAGGVPEWFERHNSEHGTEYRIEERVYPKLNPYGWNNYPFDYWNIWVNHAGSEPYLEEPTLEMLTAKYDLIVFKHCFPVCDMLPDTGSPDVASDIKRLENYKLQYEALKMKMRQFAGTNFIVWTAAPRVEDRSLKVRLVEFFRRGSVQRERAKRARSFVEWVRDEWDEPGDNVFLWDYYDLAAEGGLFLKKEHARGANDSHPNIDFSRIAAAALGRRIIDVIEGRGDDASATDVPRNPSE